MVTLALNFVYFNWYTLKKVPRVLDAFPLAAKYAWGLFKLQFLIGLFTGLWALLFYIPGIIKSFSYAQSLNVYFDRLNHGEDPTKISALDCITQSRQLMNGNKWRLFLLQLSFIGWLLLATLTLGIGFLWLTPYVIMTQMAFYVGLKGASDPVPDPNPMVSPGGSDLISSQVAETQGVGEFSLGEPIKPEPTVEDSLYNQAMGTTNQTPNPTPKRNWIWWLVGGVIAVLVVLALGNVVSHGIQSAREKRAETQESSSTRKITIDTDSDDGKVAPHNGIKPVADFTDALNERGGASRASSNKFDPSSRTLEVNYDVKPKITGIRKLALNWQSEKWLDSRATIENAWIVKIPQQKFEVGSGEETTGGLLVFHINIKTGKYDNNYYPSQMTVKTNFGKAYDSHYKSTYIDGGIPNDKSRSEYVYVFLKKLPSIKSINKLEFTFSAYAGDESTEDGDEASYEFGMRATNVSGNRMKVTDLSRTE
ncbi:hypothetical protein LOSG293_011330 [Secundilactobacillus oryzae JCM 18671]|uniref:DUF975 family protein n=2 Tax=Secundilactobacillus oryzae TaxID=1202668 RepID=A0A081BG65_9LACO|nr:hypothetical protein LOSG293_011330 [Secundilactobacillus oryzae JCM 18671]